MHMDERLFFACGSSAPVRVEHEGSAAAWLEATLAAPSVQGHKSFNEWILLSCEEA